MLVFPLAFLPLYDRHKSSIHGGSPFLVFRSTYICCFGCWLLVQKYWFGWVPQYGYGCSPSRPCLCPGYLFLSAAIQYSVRHLLPSLMPECWVGGNLHSPNCSYYGNRVPNLCRDSLANWDSTKNEEHHYRDSLQNVMRGVQAGVSDVQARV